MRTHAFAVAVSLSVMLPAQDGAPDPYAMERGPFLMTTVECGGLAGTTNKALVVRLGDRGAVAFDTEMLRLTAAWTSGWLNLRGTAYDASHGPMPSRRGRTLIETRPGPGWAHDDAFADPRPIPHGPLPREWGRYGGVSLDGDQVVVDYRIGDMDVREAYAIDAAAPQVIVRTIELGPSANEQRLVVADVPEASAAGVLASGGNERLALLTWGLPAPGLVETDCVTAGWETLAIGAPARNDHLDAANGSGATIGAVPGSGLRQLRGDNAAALAVLVDGKGAGDDGAGAIRFAEGDGDGRLLIDLKDTLDVASVSTFSGHADEHAEQRYRLYGSGDSPALDAAVKNPAKAGWNLIADVDTSALGQGGKHGARVAKEGGLGRHRQLLLVVRSTGTDFCEIDVFTGSSGAPENARKRTRSLAVALAGSTGAVMETAGSRALLRVLSHTEPLRLQLHMVAGDSPEAVASAIAAVPPPGPPVAALPSVPAKARWGEAIVTKGERGNDDGPFAVDNITIPFDNPFHSRMRTGAFDFFADGRAAVSTWNGDVWIVSGITGDLAHLGWKRFATGLFDPLGLRIVDDVVHVHGRDGITKLFDRNGDGEADRYECLDNQVLITEAFHEFAFDLQTDAEGNFYFSKGAPVNPGGRGFMKIVPHHGTILKLSKDGKIETIATGLRAPNGIGVSPDGVITSGDNEGTFMPRCRLNWIEKPGYYAGVMPTAHRMPVPEQPDLPLCWMPMEVDNSSGGQVWVTGAGWPDLAKCLLHLSYGTCSVYLVLPERVNGQMQGGVVRLPAEFSSSCMRGRFSPVDGQLYVIGLQGWQTSASREGGFHRVRRTTRPLGLPTALRTCATGVQLSFDEPLDPETAADADSYGIEIWNYLYSPNYGSPEISLLHPERKVEQGKPNRDPLRVTAAKLSDDRRTVFLEVDGMRPVHQMRVTWNVDAADGRQLRGELHNSIHALADRPEPVQR